jgi:hypothetical protein
LWKRLHEYWVYHPIWDYKLQADESTIWNILYLVKIYDMREARIFDMWCYYMASQHNNLQINKLILLYKQILI